MIKYPEMGSGYPHEPRFCYFTDHYLGIKNRMSLYMQTHTLFYNQRCYILVQENFYGKTVCVSQTVQNYQHTVNFLLDLCFAVRGRKLVDSLIPIVLLKPL